MQKSNEVTAILQEIRAGDRKSEERLVHLVYSDLKNVARRCMASEGSGHTLQPTVIVHEVFLRLFRNGQEAAEPRAMVDWQSKAHFLGIAARQMRQILIDHARRKNSAKRNFGIRTPFQEAEGAVAAVGQTAYDFEMVNLLLDNLSRSDREAAQVVELKFFGGLTDREAALVMQISISQVRLHWSFARSWLGRRLRGSENV